MKTALVVFVLVGIVCAGKEKGKGIGCANQSNRKKTLNLTITI